ncbi:MAG TPA: glycosyltransferase family 4 protein [Ottowia sp.]|nr:glycosyltransferase family 4 protein [Ottowia sp.]
MNILLINHYAGSPRHGMEFRPYYLAREWVRMGHQVQLVAGSYSHIRAQINRLGLADAVQLHGRLHDAGMAAVLARCKLSISVPRSDATSVSVLESMACGRAVIASDLPANHDWLDARPLVPAGDVAALPRVWGDLIDKEGSA